MPILRDRILRSFRAPGPLVATLAAGLLLTPAVRAQEPSQPDEAASPAQPDAGSAEGEGETVTIDAEDLPAQVRLGLRVDAVRLRIPVAPTVVIVENLGAYVEAIGAWTTTLRYPVLFDDGTLEASENIARFVRAFEPERVVRFAGAGEWERTRPGREQAIRDAVARAWDAESATGYTARLKELQYAPPGIVLTNVDDPAWTAAVALAAGRGQLLAFTDALQRPNGAYSLDDADALHEVVKAELESAGYSWQIPGDEVDALTVCLNCPARVKLPADDERDTLALTDVLGRRPETYRRLTRWGWAGQIIGDSQRAAYSAMCALFLQPDRAWLFDGYEAKNPWDRFDMTRAATVFTQAGLHTDADDNGLQGLARWRVRGAGTLYERGEGEAERLRGVDAGLIAVNTSGQKAWFDLQPGRAYAPDVPFLNRPAMVHFVHSWSAVRPAERETIAGRWLERGAYAYVGSVNEPYLSAFMPTPKLASRLMSRAPWGVASRIDSGQPWKVAVFGDPLITVGPQAPRAPTPDVPLEDLADVEDAMRSALTERRYAEALRDLVILGRDEDAVRLVRSVLAADEAEMTQEAARNAFLAVFRRGPLETLAKLGSVLGEDLHRRPVLQDAVWHALYPVLGTLSDAELAMLDNSVREELIRRDAAEAADAVEARRGAVQARAFLDRLRGRFDRKIVREGIDAVIRRR